MTGSAIKKIIEDFYGEVQYFIHPTCGSEMCIIKDHTAGKVDYNIEVIEAAHRIVNYNRMLKDIHQIEEY
jgi:hypothetical protein